MGGAAVAVYASLARWSTPTASVAEERAVVPAAYGPGIYAGRLARTELGEASGMVASLRRGDVLWAANDGGNPATLYAVGLGGEDLAAFPILGVPEDDADFEDLASLRHAGHAFLVVADVGDNVGARDAVALWGFQEPILADAGTTLRPSWHITLRYEDGPRDCEAVAVDPDREVVMLISKRERPPALYEAPIGALVDAGGGEVVARRVGELSGLPLPSAQDAACTWVPAALHMPTALDLAPEGHSAVVLSYAAAWEFPRHPGESWATAFARAPQRIEIPPLPQAEALAFVGTSLYVSGERAKLALFRWPAALIRLDPINPTLPLKSSLRGASPGS